MAGAEDAEGQGDKVIALLIAEGISRALVFFLVSVFWAQAYELLEKGWVDHDFKGLLKAIAGFCIGLMLLFHGLYVSFPWWFIPSTGGAQ
jgi:hypothetical protein